MKAMCPQNPNRGGAAVAAAGTNHDDQEIVLTSVCMPVNEVEIKTGFKAWEGSMEDFE